MSAKKLSFKALVVLITLLTGCANRANLSVHTDYLSRENLASYHVGTPDPRLDNPPIGQRLIITWSIPRMYLFYQDLHLQVTIRFRNREEFRESVPLDRMHGTYVYDLLDGDYIEKRGMLSYKVDLYAGEYLLDQWKHQIWADLIRVSPQEQAPCEDEEESEDDEFADGP